MMNGLTRWLIASMLSASIAVSLPTIHNITSSIGDESVPTFQSQPQKMTEENMVDGLANLSLRLSLAKVEWHEPLMTIDLHMNKQLDPDEIYRDILELARMGFHQRMNVDQMLIRVMEKPSFIQGNTDEKLLMTVDARRDRMKSITNIQVPIGKGQTRRILQNHAMVTYTVYWKERYGG